MQIDPQYEGAPEPALGLSKGFAFETWDMATMATEAAMSLVRRASAHVQMNIAVRLLSTGKERGKELGNWTYQYDVLNRLVTGSSTAGTYHGKNLCWAYNDFGNRTIESPQSSVWSTPRSSATAALEGRLALSGPYASHSKNLVPRLSCIQTILNCKLKKLEALEKKA